MTAPGPVARAADKVRGICDRFWLFTIAAIALMIIGGIVAAVVIAGRMPENSEALLTTAVAGLLMIAQKVIEAQAQRRMADQLAQSSPPGPVEACITNTPDEAVPVKEE